MVNSKFDAQPLFSTIAEVTDQGRQSKREAFRDALEDMPKRRAEVLAAIGASAEHGMTREQISVATGLPLATVCGRVAELKTAEMVIDSERRRETQSGKRAAVLICVEFIGVPVK